MKTAGTDRASRDSNHAFIERTIGPAKLSKKFRQIKIKSFGQICKWKVGAKILSKPCPGDKAKLSKKISSNHNFSFGRVWKSKIVRNLVKTMVRQNVQEKSVKLQHLPFGLETDLFDTLKCKVSWNVELFCAFVTFHISILFVECISFIEKTVFKKKSRPPSWIFVTIRILRFHQWSKRR